MTTTTAEKAYTVVARADQLSRDDWLEVRRTGIAGVGIGGSDAPCIAGLDRYRSPYSLWAEKTGEVTLDRPVTAPMEWGVRLEPVIAQAVADELAPWGYKVEHRPVVIASVEHPFMLANVDRWVTGDSPAGEQIDVGIVECKAPGLRSSWTWENESAAPEEYQLQCMHYLAVTGLERCWLGILIGGQELRTFDIFRDEALIERLIRMEDAFARRVLEGNPPGLDGNDATTEALKAQWSPEPGSVVQLDESIYELLARRRIAKAELGRAKENAESFDNELRARLGDAEIGMVGEDIVATWKTSHKVSYTVKASTSRRLHVPGE